MNKNHKNLAWQKPNIFHLQFIFFTYKNKCIIKNKRKLNKWIKIKQLFKLIKKYKVA